MWARLDMQPFPTLRHIVSLIINSDDVTSWPQHSLKGLATWKTEVYSAVVEHFPIEIGGRVVERSNHG
jgi:hypothetical protein